LTLYLRQAYEQALAKLARAEAVVRKASLISFWQGIVLAALQPTWQADQAFLPHQ